jgi:hypothetical protein
MVSRIEAWYLWYSLESIIKHFKMGSDHRLQPIHVGIVASLE